MFNIRHVLSGSRTILNATSKGSNNLRLSDNTVSNLIVKQSRTMTYVPLPIFIPNYGSSKPKPPVKDEANYKQDFDFRLNPLYQCNPPNVNDYINKASGIKPEIRTIINSMAPLPFHYSRGKSCIYHLAENPKNMDLVKEYKLDTLSKPDDYNKITFWMDKILTETQTEFNQVNKLITNKDRLLTALNNDKSDSTIAAVFLSALVGYLEYRYFAIHSANIYLYSPGPFSRAIFDLFHLQYWAWLFPAGFWLDVSDLSQRKKKLNVIYNEYIAGDYVSKYQLKLNMLDKLKNVFMAKI